jgi:hypothetical protein
MAGRWGERLGLGENWGLGWGRLKLLPLGHELKWRWVRRWRMVGG